jgi:hypothetical protein
MSASNRTLGRVLLVIVGLVLLLGGLAVVAVETVPQAASAWHGVAPGVLGSFGSTADRAISETAWGILLGAAVLAGILALVVLGTRGGGRVGVVIDDDGSAQAVPGAVRIESTAVQHALSSAIGAMPQVASLVVDVYRVRRIRAIRVKVRPKRGIAPREVADRVEEIIADLDALLGVRLPVLLQIARGGAGSGRPDRVH